MSEATLTDPQVRAAQNRWYLYFDTDPMHGRSGCIRAVVEEVCDEIFSGDGGPTRQRRKVYLNAETVRDAPTSRASSLGAAYDSLDWRIENEMGNKEFRRLIDQGTIIPISNQTK